MFLWIVIFFITVWTTVRVQSPVAIRGFVY